MAIRCRGVGEPAFGIGVVRRSIVTERRVDGCDVRRRLDVGRVEFLEHLEEPEDAVELLGQLRFLGLCELQPSKVGDVAKIAALNGHSRELTQRIWGFNGGDDGSGAADFQITASKLSPLGKSPFFKGGGHRFDALFETRPAGFVPEFCGTPSGSVG